MADLAPISCAPLGQWIVVVTAGRMVQARYRLGWRNREGQVIVSKIDGWMPHESADDGRGRDSLSDQDDADLENYLGSRP